MNERDENLYSSVLEEETSLLLSAAPKEAGGSLGPDEGGDHGASMSEPMGKKVLVERIRAELAIRRREDSTRPLVRRPRLDKINERIPSRPDSRTAVTTLSVREAVEPVAERERRKPVKTIVFTEKKKAPKGSDPSKTFIQGVYGIPILGYCLELLVLVFGLPVQLREINSRAAKKDAVMLARIDGIGSRVNALREGIAQCRKELEDSIAAKAALEDLTALSGEISQKADSRRLDVFSQNLDAELSKKTSEDTLDEVKAFIEMSLDDVRVEISRKAEEKQLLVLEERLASKAEEEVLEELGGRIDDAFARLDSYDEYDVASRLKSLEGMLAEVHAETRQKADAEALASLQSEYRSRAESDADSFSAIKGELAGLSERIDSYSSDSGVIVLIESKLESLAGRLDSFDMDSLVRRMQSVETALDAKADLEIIKSLLTLGVDVEVLKALCKGLEKSSGDAVSALGKKADAAALNALDKRLQALEDHLHAISSSFESKAEAKDLQSIRSIFEERLEELKLIIKEQGEAAGEDERRMAGFLDEAQTTKDLSYAARVKGRTAALRELKPGGRKDQGDEQRNKGPKSGKRVKE